MRVHIPCDAPGMPRRGSCFGVVPMTQGPESKRLSPEDFVDYLLELGSALLSYGCPSYRLEEVVGAVAALEGYEAEVFGLPTGLFVGLRGRGVQGQLLRMIRAKSWAVDLGRLVAVDGIFNDVAARRPTIQEARARLPALERERPAYPRALHWLATALVAGAAAVFFRGRPLEVGLSAVAGACVGMVGWVLGRVPHARFLVEFFGAFVAASFAWGCTHFRPGLSREVIILSAVIPLVPGMTLTTGLAELAQKNLVTGSARCMEAFVAFLSILFGIALAIGVEKLLGDGSGGEGVRKGLALPYQAAGLLCASLAFAVLFSIPRRFIWGAVFSGGIGYIATGVATRYLPGHIAAFVAALSICLFANACARVSQRPAQLFQLPGMMLLVPGSFGFLSLEDFLRGDFVHGAAKGFDMLLIGGALVTGVLLANVLLPARKLL